ncbi:hypothetical protein ASPZODRAFT_137908 [Penicilliopsis zonata CBS 506.65]|uniref:Indoleamine 2,3-dioxygenase n=1 Tax=Penicilliopsis zonata CBS 506.65 TaxID=1073090 RepID=A0A1L9SU88_9EURO|nr:hypothetical protein ASPZODRAFT_137908 [Penicilliopsis zonata CBS 506.65]OJJ50768.1 hypothetical protein ASPZODRAFT_137908 [Penicilliopsis zonata CBS 506.65]
MGSTGDISPLRYFRSHPDDVPATADPFIVNAATGFLPTKLPLRRLPATFNALSNILDEMPVLKQDGSPGLLAQYRLGPLIDSGALPDLTDEIDRLVVDGTDERDLHAITAAFRDYSFVASSYLLEPCWETWNSDPAGGYGLGRQVLPRCIAGPLVKCAEILDIPAFMSYAASYALYNYYLVDPAAGHDEYTNIHLVRAFEKGLDPKSSEAGFILTHIHMVALTGGLVQGVVDLLEAVAQANATGLTSKLHLAAAKDALGHILRAMAAIEANMEKMWSNSLPKDYMTYRTFIYGITSQSMFPDGVIYEGQYNDKPQFFRGESGANDSIIPLLDHLCEIPMPENPLTVILRDFRQYRPKPHREFLRFVLSRASELHVREFCTKRADAQTTLLYLRVLDHVRSFRWRHWLFAREYILKRTSHPTATGGSPIVTWLPNQLGAVLDMMVEVSKEGGLWALVEEGVFTGGGAQLNEEEVRKLREMMENVAVQKERLQREVSKYCEERGV